MVNWIFTNKNRRIKEFKGKSTSDWNTGLPLRKTRRNHPLEWWYQGSFKVLFLASTRIGCRDFSWHNSFENFFILIFAKFCWYENQRIFARTSNNICFLQNMIRMIRAFDNESFWKMKINVFVHIVHILKKIKFIALFNYINIKKFFQIFNILKLT